METVLPFVFIFSLGVSFMLSGLEAGERVVVDPPADLDGKRRVTS